ncbi:MAG: ABC transporter permease, partial [Planctomycetales bacterium]|nr:ABC transporter permease [Planctomycetales bacterium]
MSMWRVIWQSLLYHRRIHLSVVAGVAVAAAVLTGSLLVGASMRGSLKELTLRRLGDVDEMLVSQRFFEAASAIESLRAERSRVAGLIWLPGSTLETVSHSVEERVRRAADVQVLAGEELNRFWPEHPDVWPELDAGSIVINKALADDLGIDASTWSIESEIELTLRLPRFESLSSDSPLGEKEDLTMALPRLKLVAIVANEGPGRFSLQPSQLAPRNAFVARADLEALFEAEGKVNAIWLGDELTDVAPTTEETRAVSRVLRPSLSDYGILLTRSTIALPAENDQAEQMVGDAWYVSSDRMIIDGDLEADLSGALADYQPVPLLTYLANDIGLWTDSTTPPDGRDGVPFSMVTGVDFDESYDLRDVDGNLIGPLADDRIVLNEWTANDLGAKPGDRIRLTYFQPETTHGQTDETFADFELQAIASLTEPEQPYSRRGPARFTQLPTLANDPALTPEVPGVTDQESIENWDLPFPTADRLRDQDDDYWKFYRTTPKAFVALEAGQRLWGSRFGELTGFRLDATSVDAEVLESKILDVLHASEHRHGFEFMPIKRLGLQSASGTTPFDGLFLGLSLFVIVAALLLIVLLFRLGLERRLREVGTWLAIGFSKRRVSRLLVGEGMIVAVLGAALGTALGVLYAGLMVWGLQTWWVGAIRTPFLQLFVSPTALIIGFLGSMLVCGGTIAFTVARFRTGAVRDLLVGRLESGMGLVARPSRVRLIVALVA